MGFLLVGTLIILKLFITAVVGTAIKIAYDKLTNITEVKGAIMNGLLNVKRAIRKSFQEPIYFRGSNEMGKLSVCKTSENGPCEPVEEFISRENIEGGDIVCDSEGSCIKFKQEIKN